MRTPQEIIDSLKQNASEQTGRKSVAVLIKAAIQDAKDFFTGLAKDHTKQLRDNTYKVEVTNYLEPARVENIILGLERVIKSVKGVQQEVKNQKLEVKETDLTPIVQALEALKTAPPVQQEIKIPPIKIPPFPKSIAVSNFPEQVETKQEEPTGFYWNVNKNGDLTEIVEQYPNGNIVASGWALRRVEIDDQRK